MTTSITLFSVIADNYDWYRVWRLGVISDKPFIAFESLLTKGLFFIS
jgi:hypothetical protein